MQFPNSILEEKHVFGFDVSMAHIYPVSEPLSRLIAAKELRLTI